MLSKERLIPFYLRKSTSNQLESLITHDTEVGYGMDATKGFVPNFPEKLRRIFFYANRAILIIEEKAEKRRDKLISKILPFQEIIGNKYISEKIYQFGQSSFKTDEAKEPIQQAYISIFSSVREIIDEYNMFMLKNSELANNNSLIPVEKKIMISFSDERIIGNRKFQDRILTRILSLQIILHDANRMVNNIPGVPADPLVRNIRASVGGETSNYGEYILVDIFISYLKKNRPKKIKSHTTSEFYRLHQDNFISLLEEYKSEMIGKKPDHGKPLIRYGTTLTPSGLQRKISEWRKRSDEFIAELTFHIYSKENKNSEYNEIHI
ncbi:hypothetical protein [Comamonas terrigena]|uniref:hypothetical protein n=1 Tax=Comamonas terrigena TaxID=32013 RepID=UPI00289DC7F8|nr:hypothetical protein [Comamonas terrigena]